MIELAAYRFEPPFGCSYTDVLIEAHRLRVAARDYNIQELHLADAIENLVLRRQGSLWRARDTKNAYPK